MAEDIAHLDFEVECEHCQLVAEWAMSFSPCPACGCPHHWVLLCRSHGFQVITQRRAHCHCREGVCVLVRWKAIDS